MSSFPAGITEFPSILPILVKCHIIICIYVNLILLSETVSNRGVNRDYVGNVCVGIRKCSGALLCNFVFFTFFCKDLVFSVLV